MIVSINPFSRNERATLNNVKLVKLIHSLFTLAFHDADTDTDTDILARIVATGKDAGVGAVECELYAAKHNSPPTIFSLMNLETKFGALPPPFPLEVGPVESR